MKKKKQPLHAKSIQVDRRLQAFLLLTVAVFCILIFRLWTIQIYQQEKYAKKAEKNYIRNVPVLSRRGRILDANNVVLASDEDYYDVWIPIRRKDGAKNVVTPDVKKSLELLSMILDESYGTLEYRYVNGKRDIYYKQNRVRVASRIPWQQYVAIKERIIEFPRSAMVFPNPVPTRRYWYGELAAHIIGYTGEVSPRELKNPLYENYGVGDRIGKIGLERQYESLLRGKDGVNIVVVDKNEIQQGGPISQIPSTPGHDIVLNIDKDLQQAAEMILGASDGVIVAQDPNNGAVLAMASNPRFDPQYPSRYMTDPAQPMFHKAIRGAFEPGSVFKIFEVVPLLEELKINPNATVYCPGYFTLPGGPIWKCHLHSGHGNLNLYQAVAKSCNVFFYENVNRLGINSLFVWASEFGFNRPTGVDLPDESVREFPSPRTKKTWYTGYTVNMAIGQGDIVLTPLQVSTALCALVNSGTLYQPRVADKVVAPDGQVVEDFKPVVSNVIQASTSTWDVLHQAMWDVVNTSSGTGRRIVDPELEIAGKSGTAQTSKGDLTHAWFVCYAPYENPKIAITVILEYAGHGGEEAAPLAKQLLDLYFGRTQLADLSTAAPPQPSL